MRCSFSRFLVDNGKCRKEQRCKTDTCARPGNIFHPDFEQGHATYFDVTVRNTMQPSYVTQTVFSVGNAAPAGEREKDQCHEANVINWEYFPPSCVRISWPVVTTQFESIEDHRTTSIFQKKFDSQPGSQ